MNSERVPYREMRAADASESSAEIRAVVERTRGIQRARGFYNAQMPTRHIRKLCTLDEAGDRTLEMAVRRMGLSARAHHRRPGRIQDHLRQTRRRSGAVSQFGSQLLELTRGPEGLERHFDGTKQTVYTERGEEAQP